MDMNQKQTYYLRSVPGLSQDRAIEIKSMAGTREGGWLVRFFYKGRKPRARKDSWIQMDQMRSRFATKEEGIEYAKSWVKRLEWHQ